MKTKRIKKRQQVRKGPNGGMLLLLTEDVTHLGKQGDLVEVRPGYGRNYLIPQGMATMPSDPASAAAPSAVFLKLFGLVAGGWLMARSGLAARRQLSAGANGDARYLEAKLVTVRHYADHVLTQAPSLLDTITAGGETVMALAEDQF